MILTRRTDPGRFTAITVVTFGLLILSGCGAGIEPASIDPSSHRRLSVGEIVGFTGSYGSHVWLGIPFALPPEGGRRWRKPEPAPGWKGRREALEFGSPCPQLATSFVGVTDRPQGTYAGSEDCLVLNVYAPRLETKEVPDGDDLLPVMVWIHGGGNSVGHASFYDGGKLAQTQNVVVVMINYRLGPLGWFRHAALRNGARDAAEASGNFGILDQIEALRWVRDNIAGFGGNPDNVTIFGESAGGRDVVALLLSPLAEGLFHRAISQSGSARENPTDTAESFAGAKEPGHRNSSNEILAKLLVRAGRAGDRSAAIALIRSMSLDEIEVFLYETHPARLMRMYAQGSQEPIPDVPNVFADGTVLPATPPLELFAAGKFNRVPVMFGTNRDEQKIIMFASDEYVKNFLGFLPRLRDETAFNLRASALSTAWKLVGADAPADAIRRSGASNVYVYRWDWDEEPTVLGADLSDMIGAAHGFEIPFVFGHYELGEANVVWTKTNEPGRDELSRAMMSYWTEFARMGSPGRGREGELPNWTPWNVTPGAPKFAILDTAAGGGVRMSSESVVPELLISKVKAENRDRPREERCETYRQVGLRLESIGRAVPGAAECGATVAP